MSGSVSCPQCGHVLFAIELQITQSVQARTASPPDASLVLRVAEAARLLGVSALYELIASGQVPVVRLGRSIRVVGAALEAWIVSMR